MTSIRNKIRSVLHRAFFTVAAATAGLGAPAPAAASEDPPAGNFEAMRAETDRRLKETQNPFYDRVIILDPDRFDAEIGMGKSSIGAVKHLLAEQGYKNPGDALVQTLITRLLYPGETAQETPAIIVSPSSFPLPEDRLCILVLAPEGSSVPEPNFPPPGIDLETALGILNRHERGHAEDGFHDPREMEMDSRLVDGVRLEGLAAIPFGLGIESFSTLHRLEVWQDVTAVGEAVRAEGKSPAIISLWGDWRMRRAKNDLKHASTLALRSLSEAVGEMGLNGFRAMGEDAARELYLKVTLSSGVSHPFSMHAFLQRSFGEEEEVSHVRRLAATNLFAENGVSSYVMWNRAELQPELPPLPPVPPLPEGFDPAKILRETTLAQSGVIMPATTLKTYEALRDAERREIREHPEDTALHMGRLAGFRTAFLGLTRGIRPARDDEGRMVLKKAPPLAAAR